MGKINWGRMFLCGIVTGVVWFLLMSLVLALVAGDFIAVLLAAGVPPLPQPQLGLLAFIVNLAIGIWTIWLYAAIRPGYGPGPKTTAVAG